MRHAFAPARLTGKRCSVRSRFAVLTFLVFNCFILANASDTNKSHADSARGGTPLSASDFDWLALPNTDLSSVGAKTIVLQTCPPGVKGDAKDYYIYISGIGTPEVAKVTGGSCGGDRLGGSLQVTTSHPHEPGYSVSSASGGIQEASVAGGNNSKIVLAPAGNGINPIANAYDVLAPITIRADNQLFDGSGAVLKCSTRSRCMYFPPGYGNVIVRNLRFGSALDVPGVAITNTECSSNTATLKVPSHNFIDGDYVDVQKTFNRHFWGIHGPIAVLDRNTITFEDGNCGGAAKIASTGTGGYAAIENAAIEDDIQGLFLEDVIFTSPGKISGHFHNYVVVDNDQMMKIDAMTTSGGLRGDTNGYIGNAIYAPGPFAKNAAVIWVSNSQISLQGTGNGITDWSGNTLGVNRAVIQGFQEWGINVGTLRGGGGGTGNVLLADVYNEVGSTRNPYFSGNLHGQSGLIVEGAQVRSSQGIGPAGYLPQFSNVGGGHYYFYYVVVHDSVYGDSTPLLAGWAHMSTTGKVDVQWYRIPGTNTITYHLLRVDLSTGESRSPATEWCMGGSQSACGAVALNLPQCATIICKYSDDISLSTSAFSVTTQPYLPVVPFWAAGTATLSPASDTRAANVKQQSSLVVDNLPGNSSIVSSMGTLYPSVFAQTCSFTANLTAPNPVWVLCFDSGGNGPANLQSATILHDGSTVGGPSGNLSGRFGFAQNRASGVYQGDEITFSYASPDAALATSNYRPPANARDSAIGFDNTNGSDNSEAQIAFRAPVSISNYIGHIGDGINWLERLTWASKIFKIGVSAPNFIATPPTGKQPYATNSTKLNDNLNADMVDGKHASDLVLTTRSPTCDADYRGMFRYTAGANGVKDTLQICVKDSSDKFSWLAIY